MENKVVDLLRERRTSQYDERVFSQLLLDKRYGLAVKGAADVQEITRMYEKLINIKSVNALMEKIRGKDLYTLTHVMDTFILGTLFGKYLGMSNLLEYAKGCLLHDVGKLDTPTEQLTFNGPLTNEEFEEMKLHTTKGEEILNNTFGMSDIAFLAKEHHERLNGKGYPESLTKEFLSIKTRVLMIIDVYSAMTLDRSYRKALSSEKAISFLLNATDQFDEFYVIKFMEMLHIYPVNSLVRLANNQYAKVTKVCTGEPACPTIEIIGEEEKPKQSNNTTYAIEKYFCSMA